MATDKRMAALEAARAAVTATAQPGSVGRGGIYEMTNEEAAALHLAQERARLAAEQEED